jgi:hypothetical protein
VSYVFGMVERMFEIDDMRADSGWVDPISGIRAELSVLAGEDRAEWTAPMLSERLVELLEVRDRLDAEVLRVTSEWRRKRS